MLATVVFTSTRQHENLIDVDKVSIKDTLKKSSLVFNSPKFCHIKTIPGQEDIAKDKKDWFLSNGFTVYETVAHWDNDQPSHGTELLKDMAFMYSLPEILKSEFVLNLENDWVFHTDQLDLLLSQSCYFLSKNPEIVYHRYSRVDQPDLDSRILAKFVKKDCYGNNIFIANREFSFNPFVSRSRDMRYIAPFVYRNFYQLHPHCEMAYEIGAKYLFGKNDIFSFTHNKIVEHIGWKHTYDNFIKK